METTAPTDLDPRLATQLLAHQLTAVLLIDRRLTLRYLNSAAEMLLSTSARAALGQPLRHFFDCASGALEEHLAMVLAHQQPVTEREVRLIFADGREITVDCSMVPLEGENGEPQVLMELRQVDLQLRLTREEQLISQNEATRTLLRGLAHEIKNPLGGLRGAAQLLAMETGAGPLAEYTEIILNEVDRLSALVDDMLGSRRPLEKRPVNIHQVLERVLAVIESDPGCRHPVEREYDPSIPEFAADQDQLIQALMNILNNAVQATGGEGRVVVRTGVLRQFVLAGRRHRLVARIEVEDDGPGIPEELQQAVFYPMVTGKAEGTGLGLSIAQSIINRHGGLIEFTSRPGRTVFTLLLPMEDVR